MTGLLATEPRPVDLPALARDERAGCYLVHGWPPGAARLVDEAIVAC